MTVLHSTTHTPEKISDLMQRLMEEAAQSDRVQVGHVLALCGVKGFAFLLLILSILNVVIFMVPFLSFFLGLPMVLLAAQMVIGLTSPVFPTILLRQKIRREPFIAGVSRAVRGLVAIEHYIKPRLKFLSSSPLMRMHAFVALGLAIMVTLPLPVVNVPPSVALIFLAVGILQRDGYFILAAYTIAVWCAWLFKSLGQAMMTASG
ncbi:MAG: exopolysaccharide biosynthesis protein [Bdellovibrionales bacterium]